MGKKDEDKLKDQDTQRKEDKANKKSDKERDDFLRDLERHDAKKRKK